MGEVDKIQFRRPRRALGYWEREEKFYLSLSKSFKMPQIQIPAGLCFAFHFLKQKKNGFLL